MIIKHSENLNRLIRYFLFFITFMTPLLFSKYTKQNFLEAKEFFLLYSVSILVFLHCTYIVLRKKNTDFWSKPVVIAIILFVFSMILSFINSPNISMSSDRFLRVIIYYLIFWIAYENFRKFEEISWLLFMSIIAGGLVSVYGIAQYFGIDPFFSDGSVFGNIGRLRIFSTFGNPNFLADYLVVPFPLSFMYFLEYKGKKRGIVSLICFIMIFLVIVFTRTRGAWISVMTSTMLILFMVYKYRREVFRHILKYLITLIIISAVFFAVMLSFPKTREKTVSLLDTVQKRFTSSSTVLQRWLMWQVSIDAFKDKPLTGQGLHSFKVWYTDYQNRFFKRFSEETGKPPYEHYLASSAIDFRHAHNDYVQTLSEQGIIGLILFITIFGIPFYTGYRLLRENRNFYINLGLMASIVCVMTEAAFNFPFHRASPYLTSVLVIMAITWQTRKDSDEIMENTSGSVNFSIPDIAVIVLSFTVMIYGLNTAYRKHTASRLHKSGHQYITQQAKNMTQEQRFKNLEIATDQLEKSISYDNSEGETFYWLGYAYFSIPGKQREALKYFEQGLKYSHNKLLHLHAGIIYLNSGNFDSAEVNFQHVRYSDPLNPFPYYYLAHLYKNTRDNERKTEMLLEAVKLGSEKSAAVTAFFVAEAFSSKDERLLNGLFEDVEFKLLSPDYLNAVFRLYVNDLNTQREKELIEACLEKLDLNDVFSVINYAIEKNMDALAMAKLEHIIETRPNLAVSYFHLARIYEKRGEREKAEEQLKKYERFK